MSARVAVIVRTKDRSGFLARALADIAAQTFDAVEVVVVNDGGNLRDVEDVVAASAVSAATRVLTTSAPGGRCAAANAGLRAAVAPYVVLHDDDDLWHPDFLTRTVAVLDARPDDAGVMTATEIVYERRSGSSWVETGRVPYWAGMTGVTLMNLLEINRAVPISFLYRRALHEEVGWYDETLDAVEDWEFYLRLAVARPIAFLGGSPLAFWMQRPSEAGADANSMFELAAEHARDDQIVRDRALRAWVAENGIGLPLYIAQVEKRLRDEFAVALERHRHEVVDEIYARHPVWRTLRRLRRWGRRT